MNLIEVIVAAALFLGACSGAAQMGAAGAQAMTQSRQQGQLHEQVEAQFLAAAAVVHQSSAAPDRRCDRAAVQLQSQLAAALPPLPAGLVRELSLVPSSAQVQLTLTSAAGLRRQRWYSPAAAGLCGPGAPTTSQEPGDAAL